MKHYIFFLTLCMYTTLSCAADNKFLVDGYELNKQFKNAVESGKDYVVLNLLEQRADPYYVWTTAAEVLANRKLLESTLQTIVKHMTRK